ncbi:hypothetical protein MKW94_019188, partial [Papaver nudicaule]|nr:hypothetical protein [Papaver nudicaule]
MSISEELIGAADTTSAVKIKRVPKIMWDGPGDDLSFLGLAASLGLRKLVFWTVFVAAIVIHTSKQTVDDISHGTSKTAKYTQYSAYMYLLAVLWIVFVYTFLACLSSFICGSRKNGNKAFLLKLVKWDV